MKQFLLLFIVTFFITTTAIHCQWATKDVNTNENLYDVFFIDESMGWIVGQNTILKTIDGGNTWNPQTPPISNTRYYGVYFKDELNGWAVGKATTSTAGRIHFTNDGGNTWQIYFTSGTLPWWSVSFADENHGTIVGQEGQILYTSDGGLTWNNRNSPNGDTGTSYAVDYLDSSTGYIVGGSSPSVGYILRTVNSGNGWSIVDNTINGSLYGLDFINTTTGFTVGAGGLILKTVDSGFNWSVKPSGVTTRLEDVYFTSQNIGFAVGFSGTLLKTIDGGETWTNTSISTNTMRGVYKSNNYKVWSVGSAGKVLNYCLECENLSVFNIDFQMAEHELDIQDLSIAADGSQSTKFRFSGTNFENVSIRLLEDENQEDSEFWGSFTDGNIENNTYLEVDYTHPTYFEITGQKNIEATIQVFDNTNSSIIAECPIKIVRPSVLMVHGIWSDGESFSSMESELIQSNMYLPNQLLKMYYKNDAFNVENLPNYISQKNVLKILARNENISLGKIDVLVHSNGGLLSRLYIQSSQYENDINKLITFNTPHSGSQFANLLLDPQFFFLHPILEDVEHSPTNGVISDLRVGGTFINNLKNNVPPNRYSEIALHTLTSTKETGLTGIAIQSGWNFLVNRYMLYHLTISNPQSYLDDLFNNDSSDLIVASQSQTGGITQTSNTEDQSHLGSTENELMQNKAKTLLNANPNDTSIFSNSGYQPVDLVYNFNNSGRALNHTSNETLTIVSPNEGDEFNAGDDVTIIVNGSDGINNIVSSMGNSILPLQNNIIENSSSDNFSFTIPDAAIGKLKIVSVGFDSNGYADYDSTFINITTNAILESIEIVNEELYVYEGYTSAFRVKGNYNDGITRDITNIEDLDFSFQNNNVEIQENGIMLGISEGQDVISVNYLGNSDSAPVTILNSSALNINYIDGALENKVKVFPNPSHDRIYIVFSDEKEQNISLYDLNGRLLKQKKYNDKEIVINIENLNPGVYILNINSSDRSITKRFIKQ